MNPRMSSLLALVLVVPLGYLAILVLLYLRQDQMVFLPSRDDAAELDEVAAAQGFQPWRNPSGERIGWVSDSGDPGRPLLICHGNAGYALHRAYYRDFLKGQGSLMKVFLLEYPGYGARPGPPSETTTIAAAREAFDLLAGTGAVITVLGESLGSGVASALAAERAGQVAGLVLVTPYDSLTNTAESHYPWLPIRWLLRTRFDSAERLRAYPGPVAFVVGEFDRTVPTRLGLRLYETYAGRKKLWLVPGAGHDVSDCLGTQWGEIAAFLAGGR
jgi:hypothetical protein